MLVLGLPATHPPEPVQGLLVAGWDAPVSAGSDAGRASDPALYRAVAARAGAWMTAPLAEEAEGSGWHERAIGELLARIERKTHFALEALRELRARSRDPALAVRGVQRERHGLPPLLARSRPALAAPRPGRLGGAARRGGRRLRAPRRGLRRAAPRLRRGARLLRGLGPRRGRRGARGRAPRATPRRVRAPRAPPLGRPRPPRAGRAGAGSARSSTARARARLPRRARGGCARRGRWRASAASTGGARPRSPRT